MTYTSRYSGLKPVERTIESSNTLEQLEAVKAQFESDYEKKVLELKQLEARNKSEPGFKFSVYDTGSKAVLPDSKEDCWQNNSFDTFNEAIAYAKDWLYPITVPDDWDGSRIEFYGEECYIEVVKEKI